MKKKSLKSKSGVRSAKQTTTSEKNTNKKSAKDQSAATSDSGEIISLILRDHKPIKELILILKDPEVSLAEKQPAFAKFEKTLLTHAKAEEESLYIQLKEADDLRIEGLEGDTEHALAEQLIMEVKESEDDEDLWMAKVKVLAEVVGHHVKEEEKELLKKVRKEFSTPERTEMGLMYSQLLKIHREDNGKSKKYSDTEEVQAEYV